MFTLFLAIALLIYTSLRGGDRREKLKLSFFLSAVTCLWIWWRDISPETLIEALKPGNGYLLFV